MENSQMEILVKSYTFEEKTESVVQAQAQMKEQVDTLSKELKGLKETFLLAQKKSQVSITK